MDDGTERYIEETRQSRERTDRIARARVRRIARARREAIASCEHVQHLTINPTEYKRPLGDPMELDEDTHHLVQFHLRQMWAICLLQNMQENWGWSWGKIEDRTGKTRITWNNVTQTYFLPWSICRYPRKATQAVRQHREENRDELGRVVGRPRIGWKPVTENFIYDVTTKLEAWGKDKGFETTIFTELFRIAFDTGLSVCINTRTHHDRIIQRIGDSIILGTTEGIAEDHHTGNDLNNHFESGLFDYAYITKGKDGKPSFCKPFPMFEKASYKKGLRNVFNYNAKFERTKFESLANRETGEPPEELEAWHLLWQFQKMKEEEEHKALMEDDSVHPVDNPFEVKSEPVFTDEFKEALQPEESKEETIVDGYEGIIDSGKPISIDVLPYMLDAEGNGEVKFTVTIKMRKGYRSGYSVEEQPIS